MAESITAVCPECLSRYRLKPDLIGRRMRCTNSNCQTAFEVVAEADRGLINAVRLPDEEMWSGETYGIKEGEEPAFEQRVEDDWQSAPPPVQVVMDDDATAQPMAAGWEDAVGAAPKKVKREKETKPPISFEPPPRKRSLAPFIVTGLSLIVLLVLIAAGMLIYQATAQAEERLAAEAQQYYDSGQFGKSADAYAELIQRYSRGVNAAKYRFMGSLAKLRHRAGIVPPEPEAALTLLGQFLDEHGTSAFLGDRRVDVYEAALKILNDLVDDGMARVRSKPADLAGAETKLKLAREALKYLARNVPQGADLAGPKTKVDGLESAITVARAQDAARKEILALLASPQPDLETARDLIRRAGFENDPEIRAAWANAEETLRKLVVYKKLDLAAQPAAPPRSPVIYPDARPPAGSGPRVPALARGVLWALEAKTGRTAWVDRLGIDATTPPLAIGDNWLVIAADPPGLSLRDSATGAVKWHQPLDALPVGPAVVIGRRGFIALSGPRGRVLDFDTATGMIFGAFETGQPFAGGIAMRSGRYLFVPAFAQQVYVLDVVPDDGKPRCATTLTTGHAAGTVRTQPVVVGANLMLPLADGLGDTVLALYRIDGAGGTLPAPITARLPGWIWFAPHANVEQIAAVTDRGALGLFGFHRADADPPLYPLDDRESAPPLADGSPQRAIVVNAEDGGLVVLANGRLRQWQAGIDRAKGRRLLPGWSIEQPLGSPLHEAMPAGPGVVALTTLRADNAGAMTTTVDMATGEIVWQRPLGFAPGEHLLAAGTSVAAVDERGGIVLFEPSAQVKDGRLSGKLVGAMPPPTSSRPAFIRAADGVDWIVQTQANNVSMRNVTPDGMVNEKRITLPAALAGLPAINGRTVVLPLANGSLVRASLAEDAAPVTGPSWRFPGAGADVAGLVIPLSDNRFLVSDGGRRVMQLTWAADYSLDSAGAIELPGPPIRMTADQAGAFVAVADQSGMVTLIDIGAFTTTAKLGLAGRPITAGPVFSGGDVLFVSDDHELEAVSVANPTRRWQFTTLGDGLTGMSLLIDAQRRVIADRSGQLFILKVEAGVVTKSAMPLPAGTPIGRPLLFGDSLLVPLIDGTVGIVRVKDVGS